jgi:predicted cupin superfamily sugar epimerase
MHTVGPGFEFAEFEMFQDVLETEEVMRQRHSQGHVFECRVIFGFRVVH